MNRDVHIRIGGDGRLVLPAAFREALGIKSGGDVVLSLDEDGVRITTMKLRIERAQRRARKYIKPGTSIVDEFLAERREAAKRE